MAKNYKIDLIRKTDGRVYISKDALVGYFNSEAFDMIRVANNVKDENTKQILIKMGEQLKDYADQFKQL